jgi:hypothetical protein
LSVGEKRVVERQLSRREEARLDHRCRELWHDQVRGNGHRIDLDGAGRDLRPAEMVLVGQVVHRKRVSLGRYEDDILDVIVVDELEKLVALCRVALPAVRGNDRAEILDRHRNVHELPGDALALCVEQVMLESRELDLTQHAPGRVERGGEDLRRVDRRRLRQLGAAECAVVNEKDRRVGPVDIIPIEVRFPVEKRAAGVAVRPVFDGVVLAE